VTQSTDYSKFEKPDGDVVVLPASNRETYERKGYRVVDILTLEPGENAPHWSPTSIYPDAPPEPAAERPATKSTSRKA